MILLQLAQKSVLLLFQEFLALKGGINLYNQFLAFGVLAIVVILPLQHRWFKRVLKSKDDEIKRLVNREKEVSLKWIKFLEGSLDKMSK